MPGGWAEYANDFRCACENSVLVEMPGKIDYLDAHPAIARFPGHRAHDMRDRHVVMRTCRDDACGRSAGTEGQPSTILNVNPAFACRRSTNVMPIAAAGVHTPPGVRLRSTSRARQSAASAIIFEVEP